MKTIKSIGLTLLMAVGLASCELETSDNGHLDGFWHLTRVDTLSTGGTTDLSAKRIFWGVQVRLLNVVDYDKSVKGYFFRFENKGTTLRLYDAYEDNYKDGDFKVEDPSVLSPFGINALDETFTIENISNSRMTLATAELRLSFRKH